MKSTASHPRLRRLRRARVRTAAAAGRTSPWRHVPMLIVVVLGAYFLGPGFALAPALAPGASRAAGEPAAADLGVAAPQTPGRVALWPGTEVARCALGDREYPPVASGCLVPLDLQAEGDVTARRLRNGAWELLRIPVGDYEYPEQRLRVAPGQVDLSPEDQRRAARESERIVALWSRQAGALPELPLAPPLEHLPAAGRFGSRRIFNDQPRSPHSGADYAADRGTPVLAAADGEVALAEEHFFGGRSVFLDHGGGLISMYLHLHEVFVEPGERVTRGAVLGTVGSTGRSTGPHLHFGVRLLGARVDPALLMKPVAELPRLEPVGG